MTAFGILKFNLETYLVLVEHSAFIGMTYPDVFLSGLVQVRLYTFLQPKQQGNPMRIPQIMALIGVIYFKFPKIYPSPGCELPIIYTNTHGKK